jgi:hypothetical protein
MTENNEVEVVVDEELDAIEISEELLSKIGGGHVSIWF